MELYLPYAGDSDNYSASFNQSIFYDGENRKDKKKKIPTPRRSCRLRFMWPLVFEPTKNVDAALRTNWKHAQIDG